MFQDNRHTIYALASGKGRSGVAVVRMSGPDCKSALLKLSDKKRPNHRVGLLRSLYDPETKIKIDQALVLWFEGPNSFTGEDVLEFHIHGGPAVIKSLDVALLKLEGVRQAAPGEFSRRAFENGKLDLTEAEAINDLVMAETEAQRILALRQLDGELGQLYENWRALLMGALAFLEADIDFSDEDLPGGIIKEVRPKIAALYGNIKNHLEDKNRGQRIRHGLGVVIVGPPNIGKSCFLNFIADEDIAIVSELAGTTRDIIEIRLDMGGYPVTFFDTAGLRETNNIVEREGVKRARAKADQADIKIVLSDAQLWPELSDGVMGLLDEDSFLLLNKADLMLNKNVLANNVPRETVLQIPCPYYFVSATKGEGFGQFLNDLEFKVIGSLEVGEAPNITRARHRAALEDCQISLLRYLDGPLDPALRAEDLRLASRSLGKITGRVDVEDMLDIVFADFCIGK